MLGQDQVPKAWSDLLAPIKPILSPQTADPPESRNRAFEDANHRHLHDFLHIVALLGEWLGKAQSQEPNGRHRILYLQSAPYWCQLVGPESTFSKSHSRAQYGTCTGTASPVSGVKVNAVVESDLDVDGGSCIQ